MLKLISPGHKKRLLVLSGLLAVTVLAWVATSLAPEPNHSATLAAPKTTTLRASSVAPTPTSTPAPKAADLSDPAKKQVALQLIASAEESTTNWQSQYSYIEDIGDGRGYTGGLVGLCSGTGDMLTFVERYATLSPHNRLAKYLPALRQLAAAESSAHTGLGSSFVSDWKAASTDPQFQQAYDATRDQIYFNPAVATAKSDGLSILGQFVYFDALVMHGPGNDPSSFSGIRQTALRSAKTPSQGGNETTYLQAFFAARKHVMVQEGAHADTTRIDTAQAKFLKDGNFTLNTPLSWSIYGDRYSIQ